MSLVSTMSSIVRTALRFEWWLVKHAQGNGGDCRRQDNQNECHKLSVMGRITTQSIFFKCMCENVLTFFVVFETDFIGGHVSCRLLFNA